MKSKRAAAAEATGKWMETADRPRTCGDRRKAPPQDRY